MRILTLLLIFAMTAAAFSAQDKSHPQKIYEAEKAFEKEAAETNVRQAFLDFLAPDGIIFRPNAVNGIENWKARQISPADLRWNPTFVDAASNGAIGYTTGNSIYRAQGKTDANAVYGEYFSIWSRQLNGAYKVVLDIGIGHAKPDKIETDWKSPADSGTETNAQNSSAADSTIHFYEIASQKGLEKAYKSFAADDIRLLREGKMPIVGKSAALAAAKNDRGNIVFPKRSVFSAAAEMAYVTNTYTLTKADKTVEKGNFVQVWKLRGGKWQIVMDVFAPSEKND